MPRSLPSLLVLLLVLLLPEVAVGANVTPTARAVLDDCQEHRGVLTGRHSGRAARAAWRTLEGGRGRLSDCAQGIASRLALDARHGRAGEIERECVGHGGRLVRAYSRAALIRALAGLSAEERRSTRCLIGIYTQLRAQGSRIPLRFAGPPRAEPIDRAPAAEVAAALAPMYAPLRRPFGPEDALSPRAAGFAAFENRQEGDELLPDAARRLPFPGSDRVWAVPARGALCAFREKPDIGVAMVCSAASDARHGIFAMVLAPAGSGAGWEVWGVAADGVRELRVVVAPGRTVTRAVAGPSVRFELARLPVAIRYRASDGEERIVDTSSLPCDSPQLPCPRLPDPLAATRLVSRDRARYTPAVDQ